MRSPTSTIFATSKTWSGTSGHLEGGSPIIHLPNLERAAALLSDLPTLWSHRGVMDEQREALIRETFEEVRLHGSDLVAIQPKPVYQPLFAYIVTERVRKYRGEWAPTVVRQPLFCPLASRSLESASRWNGWRKPHDGHPHQV